MKTRVIQDDPDGGGVATATAPFPAEPAAPRGHRGRVAGGAVALALGLGALVGGGALVGVHATQRGDDGFYQADPVALTTPTRALVQDDIDVHLDGADWLLGDGRLGDLSVSATGARDGPVFVGIGPTEEVDAYLGGVARETADLGDGSAAPGVRTPGAAAPPPPASQGFWAASASGGGTRTIVWPVEDGDWSVVVMNADASADVAVAARIGARTDVVLWTGVGALAGGLVLAAGGAALIVSGRRRRRDAPDAPV